MKKSFNRYVLFFFCSGLTEWEREREQEEFARSAALYRPLNSTMAARFTTAKNTDDHRTVYEEVPAQESSDSSDQTKAARMKMFGKLTRDTFEWHPNNILCKRFNIPNPYPGSDVVGVPKIRRPKFTLGDFITPQSRGPLAITYDISTTSSEGELKSDKLGKSSAEVLLDPSDSPMTVTSNLTSSVSVGSSSKPTSSGRSAGTGAAASLPSSESDQTASKQVETNADSAPKRPPMDLFKAIFADSSDDESEASDGEEKGKTESLLIQTSDNKTAGDSASSYVEVEPDVSNVTDPVLSEHKMVEEGLSGMKQNEVEQRPLEIEHAMQKSTETEQRIPSPDIFGPALPPSLRNTGTSFSGDKCTEDRVHNDKDLDRKGGVKKDKLEDAKKRYLESKDSERDDRTHNKVPSRSSSGEKRAGNRDHNDEDLERKRRVSKDRRKHAKKRYSDSSDSEDDYRSKHKHKHKEKKKHKHKSKHRDEGKEKSSDKKETSRQSTEKVSVSDDKQILNKLKNLQNLKAGKRLRAVDFM